MAGGRLEVILSKVRGPRFCHFVGALVTAGAAMVALGSQAAATTARTSETIDGVPLVRAPQGEFRDCMKLADQLHRAVPCPGLVPDPIPMSPTVAADFCHGQGPGACGPAAISVYRSSMLMTQMNFEVPEGYIGVSIEAYNGLVPALASNGGPLGHFVFETGTSLIGEYKPNSIAPASPIPSYCRRITGESPARIEGSPVRFYQCADSSSDPNARETIQGHDMLQWVSHGMTTQVSFHGHSQTNIDLDVAIARSTVLVRPKS